jgi:hypothetical protein
MAEEAFKLAEKWDRSADNGPLERERYDDFTTIFRTVDFLEKELYRQYDPTCSPQYRDYLTRLRDWLANTDDEDAQRVLFEFAPRLTFLGEKEFDSLYQATFNGPIARWILDLLNIRLDDPDLNDSLSRELHQHTWYCPVTDSMNISTFYHVNGIVGIEHRPDFRSLAKFGDKKAKERILAYMKNRGSKKEPPHPLKRLVLLEDFVGTGEQCAETLEFAVGLDPDMQVLFVPIVICLAGAKRITEMVNGGKYPNLRYEPGLELTEDTFINDASPLRDDPVGLAIRTLAISTEAQVAGSAGWPRGYSKYGFGETGATIVLHSNTPNNTLSFVHHDSDTWRALFPRAARIM